MQNACVIMQMNTYFIYYYDVKGDVELLLFFYVTNNIGRYRLLIILFVRSHKCLLVIIYFIY